MVFYATSQKNEAADLSASPGKLSQKSGDLNQQVVSQKEKVCAYKSGSAAKYL